MESGVCNPFEEFCLAELFADGGGRHRKGKIMSGEPCRGRVRVNQVAPSR
jgi:hypothetical protein